MDFAEDEVALFRHTAQSSKKKGELVVTNLRVVFLPGDAPMDRKSLVWANIEKLEYSPATNPVTAMKITTVQGAELVMVQLIGGKNEDRLEEFQKMRTLITNARKPKTAETAPIAAAAAAATSAPAAATARGTAPGAGAAARSGASAAATAAGSWKERLKANLLKCDPTLDKLHRELVGAQILSEEDFWQTHSGALRAEEAKQMSSSRRGLTNSLWSDIVRVDPETKKKRIVLSPENKETIFRLFPHVRLAFEHEVPLNYTETEFWKKFLEAEYHSGTGSESLRHDPLFNKYESQAKDIVSNLAEQAKKRQRFDQETITTPAIDLTVSFGDTKKVEAMDNEDRIPEPERDGMEKKALKPKEMKVFQESFALITKDAAKRDSSRRTLTAAVIEKGPEEGDELFRPSVPQYLSVDLSKISSEKEKKKTKTAVQESGGVTVEYVSTGYKRKIDVAALSAACETGFLTMLQERRDTTVPSDRANKFFLDEVARQRDFQRLTAVSENMQRKDILPSKLNDEQKDIFKGLTELLCHFYSIMHRGKQDEATQTKVKAILDKLITKYKSSLEAKKLVLSGNAVESSGGNAELVSLSDVQKEHLKSVINGHLGLIERANRAWRIYAQ